MSFEELSGAELMDRGLYLQGLLQIMASDGILDERQKERIVAFALSKGFESEYIHSTIDSMPNNRYFPRSPPEFNNRETARQFIREAAELAVVDGNLHPMEKKWLLEAAEKNGIAPDEILEVVKGVPLSDPST